jgi:glycosyltransferase involved in cell wall biosynthesis
MKQYPGGLTVLMALYWKDDPFIFRKAVLSVFANSILPDDFILVIDGPLDKNLELEISLLKLDFNITTIYLATNMGLAIALNEGLKYVTTEWVARADSDDINLPNRFETQLFYALKGYDLIGGSIQEVDKNGNFLALRSVPTDQSDIIKYLQFRSPFNHMTVIFRTSKVNLVGGYPKIFMKEDYALWALLMKQDCRLVNSNEILVHATTGLDMYKRRGGLKYIISEFHLQIFLYKMGIKNLFFASLHCFIRSFVFMLPSRIRGLIYINFLRE